ncbi:MAG TPA: hypothetical protein VEJ84_11100 [Acidimicrobiales bacterium]|nr:hypothetical protein [Acidimicrobiales bacterium]
MTELGVKVVFVTHLFELAHSVYVGDLPTSVFLRAGRMADGGRTFRLVEGEPLPTSYGQDSYRRIFGTSAVSRQDAGQVVGRWRRNDS